MLCFLTEVRKNMISPCATHYNAVCKSKMHVLVNQIMLRADAQFLWWSILVTLQPATDDLALLSIFVSIDTVNVVDFQKSNFTTTTS